MQQDQNTPWQYKPNNDQTPADNPAVSDTSGTAAVPPGPQSVAWQAPEFIEHHHPAGWYMLLVLTTIVLAAIAYLTAKDYIAVGTIIILGFIVAVYAGHKPSQVQYELSGRGLSINGKTYVYSDFKSFAIFNEGQYSSVNLFPIKRFMPTVSAYFEPGNEEQIADIIGEFLAIEDRQLDAIDRLSRRLRI